MFYIAYMRQIEYPIIGRGKQCEEHVSGEAARRKRSTYKQLHERRDEIAAGGANGLGQ